MKFQYLRPVLSFMAMLIGFTLIAVPTAHAAVESVTCHNDSTDDAAFATALNALKTADDESNTLNITGNCSLTHTITIQNFFSIQIEGPSSGTATLAASPVACDTTGSTVIVLAVISTRNVSLRHFNITGGAGVLVKDSGGIFTDVSISSSRGEGLSVQGASTLGLVGAIPPGTPAPNIITGSCGDGLNVGPGSSVNVTMFSNISNNAGAGAVVSGGLLSVSGCCMGNNVGTAVIENNRAGIIVSVTGGSATVNGGSSCVGTMGTVSIRNNREWGMFASGPSFIGLSGQVTVEGNQSAPTSSSALAYRSAIFGSFGATVYVSPGALIQTTNLGHGILMDAQSKLRLGSLPASPLPPGICTPAAFGNVSITANGLDGLSLTHMSLADILSTTSMTGNSGKDARCDDSSLLTGVRTGIGTISKCK